MPSRIQEQIMDLLVPQIMVASKAFAGKVFTVEMPHQHVHQVYPGDYVIFNIKGLDKLHLLRSGDVMVPALHMDVPVPQIIEAALEVDTPQECVQIILWSRSSVSLCLRSWRPPWKLCVLHHRNAFSFVLRSSSWMSQCLRSWRGLYLHEALRRFYEQYTFEEDEEEEEEDDEEEEEILRFPPYFRPRRWCQFVVEGACCPCGSRCTFAHHESEFLGAPAGLRGR